MAFKRVIIRRVGPLFWLLDFMEKSLHRILGSFAVVGLFLAFIVHSAALFGYNMSIHFHGVWLLHLGVFLVFVPLVLFSRLDFVVLVGRRA